MKRIEQSYKQRIKKFEQERKSVVTKSNGLTILRLVIFVAVAVSMYLLWPSYKWVAAVFIVGTLLFLIAVTYHQRIGRKKRYLSKLIKINQEEIAYLNGDLSAFNTGEEFKDDQHDFSNDLDLFGPQSLFQRINRTALKDGEKKLADTLTANETNSIEAKQEVVQELAEKIDLRQSFTAEASLVESDISNKALTKWLKEHKSFTPHFAPWLSLVFSVLSVAFISLLFLGVLEFKHVLLWLLIGIGITGIYLKKINVLLQFINQTQSVFQQNKALIRLIENADLTSKKVE